MNLHLLRLVTIAALAGALGSPGVLRAQSKPELPAEHLKSLDASEASLLLGALRREQASLKNGEKAFFELYSGAPASYDQNRIGPRDAFVDLNLDHVWLIERKSPDGEIFPRYEITVAPNGFDAPVWKLEVTMTWPRDVTRIIEVKMLYGPPPPF